MRNKRLKNYLKLGVLLFGITIFVIACQKDNLVEQEALESSVNEIPISIKTVSLDEVGETFNTLKYKYQLDNHFELQQSENTQFRVSADSDDTSSIVIYTDEVKEITQGDYTSYTMLIRSLSEDPNIFYNITIEDNNGVEGMFVTQYKRNPNSNTQNVTYNSIYTKRIDDVQEPIEQEDFGGGQGGGSEGGGNTSYPTDCDGTVIPTTVLTPFTCGEGHMPGNPYHVYSSIPPHHPYYQNVTTYECWETGSDNQPDDNADPNFGGTGGNENNNNTGGDSLNPSLTSPTGVNLPKDYPCKRMKELEEEINTSNLSDYYTALNFYASNDNVNVEVGFALFDKQSNGNYNSADLIGTVDNPYISTSFLADLPPMSVYMHTHYKGLLSIFSMSDLLLMHKLIDNNRTIGAYPFVSILVTNAGTRYAIKVNDIAKFNTVANNNLYDDEKFDQFVEDYFKDVDKRNDNDTNELNFLKGLKFADMGLSLFEANDDYTEWKELTLDPNNEDNIIPRDCN